MPLNCNCQIWMRNDMAGTCAWMSCLRSRKPNIYWRISQGSWATEQGGACDWTLSADSFGIRWHPPQQWCRKNSLSTLEEPFPFFWRMETSDPSTQTVTLVPKFPLWCTKSRKYAAQYGHLDLLKELLLEDKNSPWDRVWSGCGRKRFHGTERTFQSCVEKEG